MDYLFIIGTINNFVIHYLGQLLRILIRLRTMRDSYLLGGILRNALMVTSLRISSLGGCWSMGDGWLHALFVVILLKNLLTRMYA